MNGLELSNSDQTSIFTWRRNLYTEKCQYCKSKRSSDFTGMLAEKLTVEDYQELLDQAFTRSGELCYKAVPFRTCCPYYSIKCDALKFAITKSQKKVIKRFNKFLENAPNKDNNRKPYTGDCHLINNITNGTTTIHIDPGRSATRASVTSTDVCPGRQNQRKSKLLRLERKLQKLQLQGYKPDTCMPKLENNTKTLEDLLNDKPQNRTCKFRMEFVRPMSHLEWPKLEKMEYELYIKYKSIIHKDDDDDNNDFYSFMDFFVKTPLIPKDLPRKPNNDVDFRSYSNYNIGFGSYHQLYWFDDKLIAVSIIDILPKCVSSMHFFYDPDYQSLSLGTYSLLRDVHLTRQLHQVVPTICDYYTGFYIPFIKKMSYKKRLVPSYLLSPGNSVWTPFEDCSPEISDNQKMGCLVGPNATDKDNQNMGCLTDPKTTDNENQNVGPLADPNHR